MSNLQRRASDSKKSADIESMIALEDDSKTRALLIILNSINNSMVANTSMTREVAEKLDQHLSNYEDHVTTESALVNKGLGAWKVVGWLMGITQIIIIATIINVSTRFNSMDTTLVNLQLRDEQIGGRLNNLEHSK
jgi:hypothetical protein